MKIRRQHHVWRHYLEPWTESGRIFCLRSGTVFAADTSKVAVERDFYQLKELTELDVVFLRGIIDRSPHHIRPLHEKLLNTFSTIPKLQRLFHESGHQDPHVQRELDLATTNTEELLHARIERSAIDLLASARRSDLSFLQHKDAAADFFYYLAVQLMRTKGLRDTTIANSAVADLGPFSDVSRLWNIMSHVLATNMGWSLYADRHHYSAIVLENPSGTPLLASDQPVINLLSAHDGAAPDEMELYYPLSPTKAFVYGEAKHETNEMSAGDVRNYNAMVFSRAHEFLFARTGEQLEQFMGLDTRTAAAEALAYFTAQSFRAG